MQGASGAGKVVSEYGDLAHLLPEGWKDTVRAWLVEDCPSFDYGGFVVGETRETATLYGKSPGVLAGTPFASEVFRQLGCEVEWHVTDGTEFSPIAQIATVQGPSRKLLLAERVALNILSRCSGIASESRRLLQQVRGAGFRGVLAGTRKTTPGFRIVEKFGMIVGGIDAHRVDLSHMCMLKDNHVWSKGSITEAVHAARSVAGFSTKVEVEVRSEEEADEAIRAGADIVMLDNFTGEALQAVACSLKKRWAGNRSVLLECSGGLTAENITSFVCNDIDIYSTSAVHQGVPTVDFSLKLNRKSG